MHNLGAFAKTPRCPNCPSQVYPAMGAQVAEALQVVCNGNLTD